MIKAIETRYAGCRFRSRLEARWAVLFDHMRIEWQYEPQGFELPSGPYLPDFYLPGFGIHDGGPDSAWVEVKGRQATARERRLLSELSESTAEGHVYLLQGDIPRKSGWITAPSLSYLSQEWCDNSFIKATQAALDAARSARFEHGQRPRRVR